MSSVAALATAFIFTASISSANAGWGTNGQYGNAPGQVQSAPVQSAPVQSPPMHTSGYGGQAPTRMCIRAPCNQPRPTYDRPVYVERPVYAPRPRPIYVERPMYAPQPRPVYQRPMYGAGSVYGGSTSSRPTRTTGAWNTSAGSSSGWSGYGGSR